MYPRFPLGRGRFFALDNKGMARALPVAMDDDIACVPAVIEALQSQFKVPISINTRKPGALRAAIQAGGGLIIAISTLHEPGVLKSADG